MRYVELRRHTDNDGDKLSEQGVADAEAIGRAGLNPPYAAFVSTGAERATARPSCSAQRFSGWSKACPRVGGHWLSATARQTRRPSPDWSGRRSPPWAKVRECSLSKSAVGTKCARFNDHRSPPRTRGDSREGLKPPNGISREHQVVVITTVASATPSPLKARHHRPEC